MSYDAVGQSNNFALGSDYSWTSGCPSVSSSAFSIKTPFNANSYCSSWINPTAITRAVSVSSFVKISNVDTDGSYIICMDSKFIVRIDSGRTAIAILALMPDGSWKSASAEPLGTGKSVIDGRWHKISGVYDGNPDVSGNGHV